MPQRIYPCGRGGDIIAVMTVGNELIMGAVPPERAGAAAARIPHPALGAAREELAA